MAARKPLPAQTTSFVGRKTDLGQIRRAFDDGARLVTLLGPPGIGKSRLALRHAELCFEANAHPSGIFACDLVDAASAEDICAALSRAIDALVGRDARGGDRVAELGVSLSSLGDALLVLDNFERLVGFGPETIGRWLALSAKTRFLVTSRERLRLSGEALIELGPLPVPDEGEGGLSLSVEGADAVGLFAERARAVRPGFAITPENEAIVGAIVRQLDGIPLAIELGASRMAVLSPQKLLERMPRRFDVLAADIRNATARQRTLREAIDTSWSLLEPWEQSALAQISVFRGGFSLEAAEAVVDLKEYPRAPALLDVLESLAGKSLLFTRCPPASPDEVRFGLYLSIRDYAAGRLSASGGEAAAVGRHAAYFLRMAEGLCAGAEAPGGLDRVRLLALERENLIAVHRNLLAPPEGAARDPEGALRAALSLESVLIRWGPISALQAMLYNAERAGGEVPPALALRGLVARANAAHLLGRLEESRAGYEAALRLAQDAGGMEARGIAAAGLGTALREQGRLKEAQALLTSAVAWLRASGDRRWEARARSSLGHIHTVTGMVAEARAEHEEALRLVQRDGDREQEAMWLLKIALLDTYAARLEEAEAHIEAARAAVQEGSTPRFEEMYLRALASLRQEQGQLAEARATAEATIAIARELANGRSEGFTLGMLGTIHAEMGDLAQARASLERAVPRLREAGDARAVALFTAALAAVRARLGHALEAGRLLGSIEEPAEEVGGAMLSAAMNLYRAVVELERGARSAEAGAREKAVTAARCAIAAARDGDRARASRAQDLPPAAARSSHVRVALRILEKAVSEHAPGEQAAARARRAAEAGGPVASAAGPSGKVLVISPDARRCRLPDGAQIEFKRGRSLRLMLLRLFEERLRAPGRALSISTLFASGWPGERAAADAIENRVYVGISRLRKLGFQGLLLSRDDGFLLDPSVPSYCVDKPF